MGKVIVSGAGKMKKPSVNPVGTWLLNETITPQSMSNISFTCNNVEYIAMQYTENTSTRDVLIYNSRYTSSPSPQVYIVNDYTGQVVPIGWQNQVYRTITVNEPVTDEFFTWLQANAVKQ